MLVQKQPLKAGRIAHGHSNCATSRLQGRLRPIFSAGKQAVGCEQVWRKRGGGSSRGGISWRKCLQPVLPEHAFLFYFFQLPIDLAPGKFFRACNSSAEGTCFSVQPITTESIFNMNQCTSRDSLVNSLCPLLISTCQALQEPLAMAVTSRRTFFQNRAKI